VAQRSSPGGAQTAVAILLGLGAATLTVGLSGKNLVLNTPWWFRVSTACFAIAILLFLYRWGLPWLRGLLSGDTSTDERTSITVKDSPDTTLEANVPKEDLGRIEIKDSPNTELRLNATEEESDEVDENRDNDEVNEA
jgi:hypothetical protein